MTDLLKDLEAVALLPCPFCSGAGAILDGLAPFVECDECGATGAQKESEADAIAAWNTRTHRAEIAEAVRDARRLDWLERDCTHVPDEYGMARQLYFGTYSSGQTLREAIDVAMAETGIPVTEQDQPLAAIDAQHNSAREGSDGH